MPLVATTSLPTFDRLRAEGHRILSSEQAVHQDIRELHVGLLNMMPDTALAATERQFFRLIAACNQIVQVHMHPFTIDGLPRSKQAQTYIDEYYEPFEKIKQDGLDALIISGANVIHDRLPEESFWQPLTEVFDWAEQHVTSTMCSCLATHAMIEYRYHITRTHLGFKRWGVFSHRVVDKHHPLVTDINTRFDVPHSRYNEIYQQDIEAAGLKVLVASELAGVHLAVSPDLFKTVLFQAHSEYDAISLMKEYKREVQRYQNGDRDDYPPYPEHYFNDNAEQLLSVYQQAAIKAKQTGQTAPDFPEAEVIPLLDNTWRDTAKALFNNWLGNIYQLTDQDRRIPFKEDVNPEDPLGLLQL